MKLTNNYLLKTLNIFFFLLQLPTIFFFLKYFICIYTFVNYTIVTNIVIKLEFRKKNILKHKIIIIVFVSIANDFKNNITRNA